MNFIKRALSYLDGESGQMAMALLRRQMRETAERRAPAPAPRVSAVPAATAAMQETQRRAAEDRARALAEIRMAQQQALGAMQPWQQQIQALQAAPEAIGAPEAAQIFEAGRTPVEAGGQALMRGMQEQYAPGGFRAGRMQQAMQAQVGELGGMRQQIALERTLRRRQDLMGLMGQQQAFAGMAGGIQERMGRSLADIYGQTIAATPVYPSYGQVPPFQSPYPYRQG